MDPLLTFPEWRFGQCILWYPQWASNKLEKECAHSPLKIHCFLLCLHICLLLFSRSEVFTFAFLDSLKLNYPSNPMQLKTISDLTELGWPHSLRFHRCPAGVCGEGLRAQEVMRLPRWMQWRICALRGQINAELRPRNCNCSCLCAEPSSEQGHSAETRWALPGGP